ncbi:site-specific integrase [Phyllobacterium sp. UNC302MFCol5.2]|uniref:tyrosine-type recombinase/integrase n=1 Tax=Phyllobacterium sp. UNC302MFCol5.2 TaxID=1449065 RepID=UPI00048A09E7|nr:site-specific integrase [Phyllobacterium sp. UNC302MFCol5.2]
MAMKKAKTLTHEQFQELFDSASTSKNGGRDRVMLLLSFKCGLRACEIARLRWSDVTDARGTILPVGAAIELGHHITKGNKPDTKVYMHTMLRDALVELRKVVAGDPAQFLMYTTRRGAGPGMSVTGLTVYLHRLYAKFGLKGCSSHTGRRTFITTLARVCNNYDNSLKDVQLLARHADIRTTEKYIDLSPRVIQMAISV